jgi:hypothetical protein
VVLFCEGCEESFRGDEEVEEAAVKCWSLHKKVAVVVGSWFCTGRI